VVALLLLQELSNLHLQPELWDRLKELMCDRFIPTYKHSLRKKLYHLERGNMSVQEYYAELQKGRILCGIVEDT
jgi:hypothetical protein